MEEKKTNTLSRPANRPAIWALIGVLIGFGLPVLACMGFFFLASVGLSAIGGEANPAGGLPVHVSGPLTGPAIAILEVNGTIISTSSRPLGMPSQTAADDFIRQIEYATRDPDVKAILLKVNSPGGSVVASDEIYQALKHVQKPIVVQMGEIAASGGYYVSMAADYIIANPNSLVGSIGVISTFPEAAELLEKVGVKVNVFTSGETKDFGSLFRDMTPEERAYWQTVIDETYAGFVEIVAEGRGKTTEEIIPLADGRVYTGRKALELGLIDSLGYEQDAIKKAANLGIISGEPRVIRYSSKTGLLSLIQGVVAIKTNGLSNPLLERMLTPSLDLIWMP